MRKSLLVILIIFFVAPILGGCAPYWTGYGHYEYGDYYDPDYYDPGYYGYEGYYGPYYAYPAYWGYYSPYYGYGGYGRYYRPYYGPGGYGGYGGYKPSILWDRGIRGIRGIKPSILWDRGIQGSPLNRSAPYCPFSPTREVAPPWIRRKGEPPADGGICLKCRWEKRSRGSEEHE